MPLPLAARANSWRSESQVSAEADIAILNAVLPEVPHGSVRSYWRGCRCLPCKGANAQYERQRRLAPDGLIDAEPARAHLRALKAKGVGRRQVARLTGVDHKHVWEIRSGYRKRAKRSTVKRLLACPAKRAPSVIVTAWWAKRQLDALLTEGYTVEFLKDRIGVKVSTVQAAENVRAKVSNRIAALYRRLLDDDDLDTESSRRANTPRNAEVTTHG